MAKTTSSQEDESRNDAPTAMTSAQRAALFRRRRRRKVRVLTIEFYEEDVDRMIKNGLLRIEDRDSRSAIVTALYAVLDRSFSALAAGRLPK